MEKTHLPLPRDPPQLLQPKPLLSPLQDPSVLLGVHVERFLVLLLDGDHPQLWRSGRVPTRFVLRDPSASSSLPLLLFLLVVVLGGRIEDGGGLVGVVVVVGGRGRGEGVVEAVRRVLLVGGGVMERGRWKRSCSSFAFVVVVGRREVRLGELMVLSEGMTGGRSGEGKRRGGRVGVDEIVELERGVVDGRVGSRVKLLLELMVRKTVDGRGRKGGRGLIELLLLLLLLLLEVMLLKSKLLLLMELLKLKLLVR